MWLARTRLLLATAWVGSLWAIGYVVAPSLFATLPDRVLAGTIAGSLFRVEAWLSLIFGLTLVGLIRVSKADSAVPSNTLIKLIAAMLFCTVIGYFGLQPWMAALREAAGPAGVMASEARMHFGILHGASSAFYLIQSLLGAVVILKIR
jgi:hypothetical protein